MKNIRSSSEGMQGLLLKKLSQSQTDARLLSLYLAKQKSANSSHQLLPVLFDFLGEKAFINLLRVMAGKRITFPAVSILVEGYTMILVYKEMQKIKIYKKENEISRYDSTIEKEKLKELSKQYKCNAKQLYKKAITIHKLL